MKESEYAARIVHLMDEVRAAAPPGTAEEELFARYQEAEFNLTIDYRLGEDFPPARRAALAALHRLWRKKSEMLMTKLGERATSPQEATDAIKVDAERARVEYLSLLSVAEYEQFFGLGSTNAPRQFDADKA